MQREKITYYVRSIYEYVFLQFAHVVLFLRAATSISRQVSSKLFSAIIIWSIFLDFPIGRGWQRLNSVYLLSADVHTHYLRNEEWMGDISANVYTDHSYQVVANTLFALLCPNHILSCQLSPDVLQIHGSMASCYVPDFHFY